MPFYSVRHLTKFVYSSPVSESSPEDSRRAAARMPLGPEIGGISVVISPPAAREPVTPQSRSTRNRSLTSGPWLAGA